MTLRACADCGKTFLAKNTKRIYCDDCGIARHREAARLRQQQQRTIYEKTCPTCGKTFQTQHYNTKYCSTECAMKARMAKEYVSRPKVKEAPKPKKTNIREVVAEAERLGLTYGQYVARFGK